MINYIPDPFVNALAWSILHSMWQIAVIALLWRISLLLSRKAPALVKQNLSIFAILTIPVVFLLTFFKQYSVYSKVHRIAYLEFEEAQLQAIDAAGSLYILQKESNAISLFLESYTPLIFWLYWIGIALFSVYFILSYSKLLRLRNHGLICPPDAWKNTILSAKTKTNITAKVNLWLSPHVSVPVVIGFFKPLVLFPLAVSSSLTMEEVEEILLHEFYHIRCKDHYLNTLQYLLEILFFYHPVTWWISQTLRAQREAKVDEWVVNQTHNPLKYAQTLISLEEKRNTKTRTALAATGSHNSLLNRIKNIMHMKTRNFKPGQKIAAIFVIAAATLSLAWLNPPAFFKYNEKPEATLSATVQPNSQQPAGLSADTVITSSQPSRIVLEDGNTIEWSEISEEDKAEIKKAMHEAKLAIREAMHEVRNELQSEEFKMEMRQAREEIKQAMAKVDRELNSEEFRTEMRQAREEIRRALEEVDRELNSQEFKAEMQQAKEEIRLALKEVDEALNNEEFKVEMKEVSKELQKVFQEMENIDWAEVGVDLNSIMQEVGKSLEIIGPTLNEVFQSLNFEELLNEAELPNK